MDDLLANLKHRIEGLITQHTHLQQTQDTLQYQKKALLVKQQKVATHIESLISKLKTLEETS